MNKSKVSMLMQNGLTIIFFMLFAGYATHHIIPIQNWGDSYPTHGDSVTMGFIAIWGAYAIFHNPLSYYDPPMFYPSRFNLPGTDGMELPALIISPIWYLTKSPCYVVNGMVLISFFTTLLTVFIGCRKVFGWGKFESIATSVVFAVCSDRFFHGLGHYNLIWVCAIPAVFFTAWNCLDKPKVMSMLMFAFAIGCSVYFSVYYFALAGLLVPVTIATWMISRWKFINRKTFILIILGGALGVLLASPKITIYYTASKNHKHMRNDLSQAVMHSATLSGWTIPTNSQYMQSNWYRLFNVPPTKSFPDENDEFVGYFMLLLVAAETIRLVIRAGRRQWDDLDRLSAACITFSIIFVLLSFGPNFKIGGVHPYLIIYKIYLQYTGFFRVPARFAFVVQLLLALPVGVFFNAVAKKVLLRCPEKLAILAGTVCLVCWEHIPQNFKAIVKHIPIDVLGDLDKINPSGNEAFVGLTQDMLIVPGFSNTQTWRKSVNGYAGSPIAPWFDQLVPVMRGFPSSESLQWLALNNVPWVVIPDSHYTDLANKDKSLEMVSYKKPFTLYKLKNMEKLKHGYTPEIEQRISELEKDIANTTQPIEISFEGGCNTVVGGSNLTLEDEGKAIRVSDTTRNYLEVHVAFCRPIIPALYKEIQVLYEIDEKAGSNEFHVYWKGSDNALSEERKLTGELEKISSGKGMARVKTSNDLKWFEGKDLTLLRLDFHHFEGGIPATLKINGIRLIPTEGEDVFNFTNEQLRVK